MPSELRSYGREDVAGQRVPWSIDVWASVVDGRAAVAADLADEVETHGGIRRSFVHDRSEGDPVELFLAAMAWGFGLTSYGPARVMKMMASPNFEGNVGSIIDDARTSGAAEGWTSLLLTHKIHGLGMAFGTKLLYFAAYTSGCTGPRPLVLDQFVRAALVRFGAPIEPRRTIWRDDYVRYLTLAETWTEDESWDADPDVVEFGLFDLGKKIARGELNVGGGESESRSGAR